MWMINFIFKNQGIDFIIKDDEGPPNQYSAIANSCEVLMKLIVF